MGIHHVSLYLHQFIAVQMDQFPAFFTFAVETDLAIAVNILTDIFKTRRIRRTEVVFIDQAFIGQLLQLTINRSASDRS